ncbi:MAG: hypothetical protein V4712_01710 [Pseudomonadota bacterium]
MVTFNIIIDAKQAGTADNDVINGTSGSDLLVGRGGDDLIVGNAKSDFILGNTGSDILFGRGGRDMLYGGMGDDRVMGGGGNDTVSGDFGRDVLFGGNGDDIFAFFARTTDAMDIIKDYAAGDSLMLIGYAEGSVYTVQDGANTLVFDGDGPAIALIENTTAADVELAYAATNPF